MCNDRWILLYKTSWDIFLLGHFMLEHLFLGHFSSGSFDNGSVCLWDSFLLGRLSLGTLLRRLSLGTFLRRLSLWTFVSWDVCLLGLSWDICPLRRLSLGTFVSLDFLETFVSLDICLLRRLSLGTLLRRLSLETFIPWDPCVLGFHILSFLTVEILEIAFHVCKSAPPLRKQRDTNNCKGHVTIVWPLSSTYTSRGVLFTVDSDINGIVPSPIKEGPIVYTLGQ